MRPSNFFFDSWSPPPSTSRSSTEYFKCDNYQVGVNVFDARQRATPLFCAATKENSQVNSIQIYFHKKNLFLPLSGLASAVIQRGRCQPRAPWVWRVCSPGDGFLKHLQYFQHLSPPSLACAFSFINTHLTPNILLRFNPSFLSLPFPTNLSSRPSLQVENQNRWLTALLTVAFKISSFFILHDFTIWGGSNILLRQIHALLPRLDGCWLLGRGRQRWNLRKSLSAHQNYLWYSISAIMRYN